MAAAASRKAVAFSLSSVRLCRVVATGQPGEAAKSARRSASESGSCFSVSPSCFGGSCGCQTRVKM